MPDALRLSGHSGVVYRDYCNTCGAKRDKQHRERCHLTGVVGAWSGVNSKTAPLRQKRLTEGTGA